MRSEVVWFGLVWSVRVFAVVLFELIQQLKHEPMGSIADKAYRIICTVFSNGFENLSM